MTAFEAFALICTGLIAVIAYKAGYSRGIRKRW
jgi:hypothetical protein